MTDFQTTENHISTNKVYWITSCSRARNRVLLERTIQRVWLNGKCEIAGAPFEHTQYSHFYVALWLCVFLFFFLFFVLLRGWRCFYFYYNDILCAVQRTKMLSRIVVFAINTRGLGHVCEPHTRMKKTISFI